MKRHSNYRTITTSPILYSKRYKLYSAETPNL